MLYTLTLGSRCWSYRATSDLCVICTAHCDRFEWDSYALFIMHCNELLWVEKIRQQTRLFIGNIHTFAFVGYREMIDTISQSVTLRT